jgi:hypothetical protein
MVVFAALTSILTIQWLPHNLGLSPWPLRLCIAAVVVLPGAGLCGGLLPLALVDTSPQSNKPSPSDAVSSPPPQRVAAAVVAVALAFDGLGKVVRTHYYLFVVGVCQVSCSLLSQVGYLVFYPLILRWGVAAAMQVGVVAYCVAWICWRTGRAPLV